MSDARKMFRLIVLFGVAVNWAFGIWATLLDPHGLLRAFALGDQADVIWLYNYSVLLMILSLFYIPAAFNPFRYKWNAWLLIVGRLVPASTFVLGYMLGFMPRGILRLAAGDTLIGVLELITLVILLREGPRPGDLAK